MDGCMNEVLPGSRNRDRGTGRQAKKLVVVVLRNGQLRNLFDSVLIWRSL